MIHVAEYLRIDWGIESHFFCSTYLAQDMVGKHGFNVLDVPRKLAKRDYSDLIFQAAETTRVKVILFDYPDSIYLDHEDTFKDLLDRGYRLVFFNNFTRTRLLSYKTFNYFPSKKYQKNPIPGPGLLLEGLEYFILSNPLKHALWRKPKKGSKEIKKILIHLDGVNQNDLSLQALKVLVLNHKYFINYQFHIVLGPYNEDIGLIRDLIRSFKNFNLHHRIDNLNRLMTESDLGLFSWGHLCFEALSHGLPFCLLLENDHFMLEARNLEKLGGCINLGVLSSGGKKILVDQFKATVEDEIKILSLSKAGPKVLDGRGGWRIGSGVMELISLSSRH